MSRRLDVPVPRGLPLLTFHGRSVLGAARLGYLIGAMLALSTSVYVAAERYPDTEELHCEGQAPTEEKECLGVYLENGIQRSRIIVAGAAIAILLFALAFRRRLDVSGIAPRAVRIPGYG